MIYGSLTDRSRGGNRVGFTLAVTPKPRRSLSGQGSGLRWDRGRVLVSVCPRGLTPLISPGPTEDQCEHRQPQLSDRVRLSSPPRTPSRDVVLGRESLGEANPIPTPLGVAQVPPPTTPADMATRDANRAMMVGRRRRSSSAVQAVPMAPRRRRSSSAARAVPTAPRRRRRSSSAARTVPTTPRRRSPSAERAVPR